MPLSPSQQIIHTPYYSAWRRDGGPVDITFAPSATDAESDMRPPNTTRQIDEHGEVNYYAAADNSILEDRKLLANWKEKLGEALTRDVVKAAVIQQKDTWTGKTENSTIRDFPAGYELFIHRKGDHYSPRIDAYLYDAQMQDTERFVPENGSPSKLLSKQQRSSLFPSPAATEAALILLSAFVITNTPGSLMRAFPTYPQMGNASNSSPHNADEENEDSFVARESQRIKNARDCWAVLREDFAQRKSDIFPSPRKRRSARIEAHEDNDDNEEPPSAVGQYAWPVLSWIVNVLEKDEALAVESGQPRHSTLLLSQIPPPRTGSGARWDLNAPLDVAFCAIQQVNPKYRSLGARLLTLLINLAATTHIDLPIFLNSVGSRVFSLPPGDVTLLLGALPSSREVLQLKLALYKSYLTDFGSGANDDSSRPKPHARAQPRPVAARRRQDSLADGGPVTGSPALEAHSQSIVRKYPRTSPSEVVELIRKSPLDVSIRVVSLRVKADLAITYWTLQRQTADAADVEWLSIFKTGQVKDAIEAAFAAVSQSSGCEDDLTIRETRPMVALVSAL
ncbi:predicted protein [Postia placenta Mad-698-R]|nr:predicted protein [Postia placenta Mad-698-R]